MGAGVVAAHASVVSRPDSSLRVAEDGRDPVVDQLFPVVQGAVVAGQPGMARRQVVAQDPRSQDGDVEVLEAVFRDGFDHVVSLDGVSGVEPAVGSVHRVQPFAVDACPQGAFAVFIEGGDALREVDVLQDFPPAVQPVKSVVFHGTPQAAVAGGAKGERISGHVHLRFGQAPVVEGHGRGGQHQDALVLAGYPEVALPVFQQGQDAGAVDVDEGIVDGLQVRHFHAAAFHLDQAVPGAYDDVSLGVGDGRADRESSVLSSVGQHLQPVFLLVQQVDIVVGDDKQLVVGGLQYFLYGGGGKGEQFLLAGLRPDADHSLPVGSQPELPVAVFIEVVDVAEVVERAGAVDGAARHPVGV